MTFSRPRLLRIAALVAVSTVLGFALHACSSSDGGTGPDPVNLTISVTPTSLSLEVGQTATVTATVGGGTGSVTFSSSNSSVATVSGSGLVTAAAVGTTTITASVVGQSNVRATTQVTVTAPPASAFSIVIDRITQNGQAADLQDLSGTVEIVVVYDAPDGYEGTVDILLDDELLVSVDVPQESGGGARASVGGGVAPAMRAAAVARAAFTPAEAAALGGLDQHFPARLEPAFRNDSYGMDARLRDREGSTIRAVLDGLLDVQVNNPNAFATWMTASRTTPDPVGGFDWLSGEVTVDASYADFAPANFPAGSDFDASLRFGGPGVGEQVRFFLPGGVEERVNASGGPAFIAQVLLALDALPDGIGGFEGEIEIESIIVTPPGGAPLDIPLLDNFPLPPGAVHRSAFLDNRPPQFGGVLTFAAGETEVWINDSWQASAKARANGFFWDGPGASVTDGGIGGVICEPFATDDGTTFFPAGTGGDFPFESIEPRFGFHYDCKDSAGNTARFLPQDGSGNPQLIGTDFTDPSITRASGTDLYGDREITLDLTRSFGWDVSDARSGIDVNTWNLAYEVDRPGVTDEERCVIGQLNTATRECEPVAVDDAVVSTVDLGILRASFFTPPGVGVNRATLEAVDRAGNRSVAVSTTTLNDPEPPVVTEAPTHDGTLTGGGIEEVSYAVTDNVDNFFVALAVEMFNDEPFSHTGVLGGQDPFFGGYQQGWGDQLTVSETIDPFITSVEPVLNLFNPQPNGIPVVLRDLVLEVVDVGGNSTTSRVNVQNDWEGQVTGFLNQGLTYHNIESLSSTGLCAPQTGDCGTNPTTLTINLRNRTQGVGSPPLFSESFVYPYAKFPGPSGQTGAVPSSAAVEDTWRSLREFLSSVTITSTDMGTFTEHDYEIVLDGTGMTLGLYELIVLGVNSDGNAVKTISNFFQVQPGF